MYLKNRTWSTDFFKKNCSKKSLTAWAWAWYNRLPPLGGRGALFINSARPCTSTRLKSLSKLSFIEKRYQIFLHRQEKLLWFSFFVQQVQTPFPKPHHQSPHARHLKVGTLLVSCQSIGFPLNCEKISWFFAPVKDFF